MSTTIVPVKLITADEFLELESDEASELVRGEIVEMTRPGARHGLICNTVGRLLGNWSCTRTDFFVINNDAGVITERAPDTVRGPDVLVIRKDRLPDQRVPIGWLTVPPDLCVEVLSPHDRWNQVLDKVSEYLDARVNEVWVIDSEERVVHVFRSDAAPRSLSGEEQLQSEATLPGFCVAAKQFFAGI